MTNPTITAPLADLTVIEYGNDLAAAYCGKHFADLGATVLVAHEGHLDQERLALRTYLDESKHPLCELPGRIDVAIVPKDADHDLATVTVHISDFGEIGPQTGWRGGDLIAQASSGLLSLIGDPTRFPLALSGHSIDYTTGWMAFTGAQIALTAIELGNGAECNDVRISRLEAGAYVEWKGRVYAQAGNELARGERSGPLVIRCADGYFGFYYRAADWDQVLSVLDDECLRAAPFDTHAGRLEHNTALVNRLEVVTAERTQVELYQALQGVGVPAGPVMTAEQLVRSEQYAAQKFLQPLQIGGVTAVQPAAPVMFNGLRPVSQGRER
ncbi:CoA transferase [Nocardia aurea]|uniref:CoA transferase n=1 Tax=Nocardia aurea TaxID=2144174 RepID=UPI0013008731|nr:CoA transferase [Nocardia aurea]